MLRRSILTGIGSTVAAGAFTRARAQAAEIRIGALSANSGPAAFIGATEKNCFEMLVEQLNAAGGMSGHKIVPFYYDTEGNSTTAAQQFRRLAESDKVDVIIGPSTTGEAMTLKPIANELKVPMISMTGTEALVLPPTPYVFKVAPTDNLVTRQMLDFAKSKGWNTVGIITSADGFGQAGANYLKRNAASAGVTVAAAEEFGPRDTDMTPQLLRLRRAEVDALLIWSVNPGPTIILKNAAALGWKKPIINSFGVASEQLLQQAGAAAEGTYVSSMRLLVPDDLPEGDPLKAVVSKVAAEYKARFKANVTTFAGHPFDAMTLVRLAVAKTGGAPSRDSITQAIDSGIQFAGCNGLMDYSASNQGGQAAESHAMVMLLVKGGKFTLVT